MLAAILFEVPRGTVRVIWALLLGVPTSGLSVSWFHFFHYRKYRSKDGLLGTLLAFMTLSLSYAIFLCALLIPRIVGTLYSDRGFLIILVNLILSLGIVGVAWWKESPLVEWITVSATVNLLVWVYAWVVSAAV